jgi:hypothetical protein
VGHEREAHRTRCLIPWGELGIPLAPHDRARFERYQEKAQAALGADAFEQARREDRSMTVDQAVAFALAEPG